MDLQEFHPTRRSLIRALLIAGGLTPAMMYLLGTANANSKVPVIPGFQEINGDVRLNGKRAKIHQPVSPGDVVTTGANASTIIIIGEHAYMMRENAEIEFYAEDFEQSPDGAVSGIIKIISGAVLSVFGKTNTTITTPLASIGIRGTACYVDAMVDRTYACVCYGTGELGGSDGKHLETVVTTRHDAPRFIYPSEKQTRIEKAKVIDHSDDELRLLEKLVNRRPLFDRLAKRGGGSDGGGDDSGY